MPAPHPRMHGLTHVVGGPDPVPGLLPAVGGSFDGVVRSFPDLLGYWRLGETSEPWADSSGIAPQDDLAEQGAGTALTPHVEGALPAGADDGALHFNYDGSLSDGGRYAASGTLKDFGLVEMTAMVWANVSASALDRRGNIVGNQQWAVGSPGFLYGWALQVVYPGLELRFSRGGPEDSELYAETTGGAVAGEWNMVVGTYDGATIRLYVNAELVAETADSSGTPAGNDTLFVGYGADTPYPTPFDYRFGWFTGTADEAAVWTRALSQDEINLLYQSAISAGEGWVLTVDEDGHPVWAPPDETDVTVNGEEETYSFTPVAPFTELPDDPTTIDPAIQWMMEQPFCWHGGEFEVPPKKWTTIPFTEPLMERQSNVTGGSTTWFELDWDDPRSAGWIDPSRPRSIIVPHDMPFFGDAYSWMQICLKLEIPAVEPDTSSRWLRIFEATHQKPLVVSGDVRSSGGVGHGAIDVFRDQTAFTPVDGSLFATGDPGGEHAGEHGNIMFVPATLRAYYLPGFDWLPRVGGQATLKEGMRLVAQVWHDASVPLTFDCTGVYPWRPHFVFTTPGLRAWGPPWSDWPEDED